MSKTHEENDIFANIPKSTRISKPKVSQPKGVKKTEPLVENTPSPPKIQQPRGEKTLRALWTLTAIISMTVNVIVIVLLVILYRTYSQNKTTFVLPPEIGVDTPVDLLGGLYDNFQLMDQAHITTNIIVEDTIPVKFDLPLKQTTVVTLVEPVTISGARVTLATGGLNIVNAPATVILPTGTTLPIMLDLIVPVNEEIGITLNVPVDIPLEQTDLHTPFLGLQKVLEPLYCLVAPNAQTLNGVEVCQ